MGDLTRAARPCVLLNTRGRVAFPASLPRLASLVTHPCPSRDEPAAPAWTLVTLPTSPAVSATATASQGRGRDGRRPFQPAPLFDEFFAFAFGRAFFFFFGLFLFGFVRFGFFGFALDFFGFDLFFVLFFLLGRRAVLG